ncbi:MAG: T9SS type A sorting domain-containing protein, partial [Bacteroidota bacterium]|nr:T9SS type A sorting domain-containing protein [Bacteroidota bacterium]MDX5429914.1 T9SS type A sorting domain-containing protein [Bacteroidota bacterium]MDX5468688.1 T9SS type A sorting domain-containing protein [Bacteroidota bacterium]
EGIFAMATDSYDRIYAAAGVQGAQGVDVLVFRMNLDGVLDTNFGDKGAIIHEVSTGSELPHSIIIDENNRPVIMGSAPRQTKDIFVLRLEENGARDSSFSVDGVLFLDPENVNNEPAGIAIRPSSIGGGYYVLCYQNVPGGQMATITSVSSSGNWNIDLGGPGELNYRKSGHSTVPQDIAYHHGDLYISGTFKGKTGNQDAFISCIQTNGKLKTTYGDSGSVVVTLSPANLDEEVFYKMLVSSDSTIYAVGMAQQNGVNYILTAHFDQTGNKVGLFGNGGGFHKTTLPNGALDFTIHDAALDDKRGRLYVSGSSELNLDIDFFAYAFITEASEPAGPNGISLAPESLKVYPNPAKDQLYLDLPGEESAQVKLVDIAGRVIEMNSEMNVLDLTGLENGVYFLIAEQNQKIYTTKIHKIN